MRLLGAILLKAAEYRLGKMQPWLKDPWPVQQRTLIDLVRRAEDTQWGRRFDFSDIRSVEDYQRQVPLAGYDDFAPYWEQAAKGVPDVTWPGNIRYFALTSGTTSGNKIIPVSEETRKSNQRAGFDTLAFYLLGTRDTHVFDSLQSKFLFLGGSTSLRETEAGTCMGDLSGIQTVDIPFYLKSVYSPGEEVAQMENWEEKIVRVAEVTSRQDVRAISGIPSWLGILFDHVRRLRGVDHIREVWPNLRLLIHGGVDFSPYRNKFRGMVGADVRFLEVYPASEGFLAMQNNLERHDMLLMLDYDIFYEFVPVQDLDSDTPRRLTVAEVDTETNYAVVMSTNSGIWAYILGDTVRFTHLFPHKIRVTGRTKHFLSAFGEHMIVEEADQALAEACRRFGDEMVDYTVAPLYPEKGRNLPAHQWLIEFEAPPGDPAGIAEAIDEKLCAMNEDYAAHRSGGAGMLTPEVVAVPEGSFYEVMRRRGKLGGQNKVPRLQNDRELAEQVLEVCREKGGPVAEVSAGEAGGSE